MLFSPGFHLNLYFTNLLLLSAAFCCILLHFAATDSYLSQETDPVDIDCLGRVLEEKIIPR